MRKFRMLTATALIGAMVFGVTACGQPKPTTVTTEPTTTVTETETTPSESETTPSETTTEATKETTCPFSNDEFAGFSVAGAGLSSFEWNGASLEVGEDNGMTYPKKPNYAEGQDIVFTFTSTSNVTLDSVAKITSATMNAGVDELKVWSSCQAGGEAIEGVTNIKENCTMTNANGVYTVTIPASVVENGNYYFIAVQNADTNNTAYIWVRCEA